MSESYAPFSSGGFAHVYLVRTAQPVYNTSHHVLKRIAVPNETMLSEVKKEVDIMVIRVSLCLLLYALSTCASRESSRATPTSSF